MFRDPEYIRLRNANGEYTETNPLYTVPREWGVNKFELSAGNIIYSGMNLDTDAVDSDADWVILKYTYTGSDITKIQRKIGSWQDRATYF